MASNKWRWLIHTVKDDERDFITAMYKYTREELLEYVLQNMWKHFPDKRWYKSREILGKCMEDKTKIGLSYMIGSFQEIPVLKS